MAWVKSQRVRQDGYPDDNNLAAFGMSYGEDNQKARGTAREHVDRTRMEGDAAQANSAMLDSYNTKYREYIDLVDQLRSFGLEREVPLPQVAVIGVQTSGKSSVLEAISGVALPRGTGTVTRCPIELRLKFNPNREDAWRGRVYAKSDKGQEYDVTIGSPEAVASEVERAQKFVAGESGFSSLGVILEIHSHFVPDLTLVDLPGLIEVAMDGMESKSPQMVLDILNVYMQQKETILMVVIPCTMEIATTKALRLALDADKDGSRTLGVLTKPDLVDRGAEPDIVNMIRSPERYKIRKGFTIVKLRGKEDVDNGMPLHVAFAQEKEYFKTHSHYGKLPKHVVGIDSLATKLTYELVERIKSVLPALKSDVHMKLRDVDFELDDLGRVIPDTDDGRRQLLTDLLNEFTDKVWKITEAIYERHLPTDQKLLLFTRPYMEDFATIVCELMPDDNNHTLKDRIEREIREQRGMDLPGFLSYQACRNVIQRLLEGYMPPARDCLHKINSVVEEFLRKICEEKFGLFPSLESRVKLLVDDIIREEFQSCDKALTELFEIEMMVVVPDLLFYKGLNGEETRDNISMTTEDSSYAIPNVQARASPVPMIGGHPSQLQEQDHQQNNAATKKSYSWFTSSSSRSGRKQQQQQKRNASVYSDDTLRPVPDSQSLHHFDLPEQPHIPQARIENRENMTFTLERIISYFRTALDRLMGTIPARIHYHLVHRMAKEIKSKVSNLATDPETLNNLAEHERTAQIREQLGTRRECLQKSLEELNRF